jgi:hypothetical protein
MRSPNEQGYRITPVNANGQRELAGCRNQNYAGKLIKKARGVKALRGNIRSSLGEELLPQEVSRWRRHPIRQFFASLPGGLDRLAWLGLRNPRRDGWKEGV